ncbi:MAG TPA: tRNA pseudouridine(38-40) synthase TruA [Bacteroidota bacterium]|nr:tRNA pseudouridine(38-40) synthase TruA [Bacteroidota bacterium]HRT68065.1 tRNA pseudouridine(38-40) synthase TruA [Bacteroidota bacterium]
MLSIACLIEYDGTNYAGWQIQNNADTIQNEMQIAWKKLTSQSVNFIGAGRTDAGVHSKGQVASAKIDEILVPENKIAIALNSKLPNDIKIKKAKYIDFAFHPRFDAIAREYNYYLGKDVSVFQRNYITDLKFNINESKLFEIASIFLGAHNFTTFSKINEDIKNNNCIISKSEWEKLPSDIYKYTIISNHFLYGMIRALVGVMIDYARGKRTKEDIRNSFEKENRALASGFAFAKGLFLKRIYYAEEIEEKLGFYSTIQ